MKILGKIPLYAEVILIVMVMALMYVWSLPAMTALRNSLIYLSLFLALPFSLQSLSVGRWRKFLPNLTVRIYFILTIWIVVCTFLFSDDLPRDFHEIWGQWIRSMCTGLLGFSIAVLSVDDRIRLSPSKLLCAFVVIIFLQVFLHDADMIWRWWRDGVIPLGDTRVVESRTVLTYIVNLLLAILAAEAMGRILFSVKYLPISSRIILIILAVCLFASYSLRTRNGLIGTIVLLLSCVLMYWFVNRRRVNSVLLLSGMSVGFVLIGFFSFAAFKVDPRWSSLLQTIPIAWDTEGHQEWVHDKLPLLPDGSVASASNYQRIVWAKEAVLQIIRRPLGSGYNRSSFGLEIKKIRPDLVSVTHSHSGILDFTISNGVPGLIIYLTFLWSALSLGLRTFFVEKRIEGLLLSFIVTGFLGRSLLDSNIRDHMLEQFMFLFFLMLVFSFNGSRR